jgi:hypothetical protein
MVAISALAMSALVQFPFSAPIYFVYIAPLLVLAILAVQSVGAKVPRSLLILVAVFYVVFAVARVTPGFIYSMGVRSATDEQTERLELARGGLLVPAKDAGEYRQLIELVRSHVSGDFTYAGPDAPEVYFLAGLRNPTRSLFDFFDKQDEDTKRILQALTDREVASIVINNAPGFSLGLTAALADSLAARYPDSSVIGRFVVRWR